MAPRRREVWPAQPRSAAAGRRAPSHGDVVAANTRSANGAV